MHSMCILLYALSLGAIHATLKREDLTSNATFKNERRFPNGSVIGTYRYKDESGNTVFVRYYADDSSYSVELKSVRNIEDNSEQSNKQDNLSNIENMIPSTNIFGPAVAVNATKYITTDNFYKNNSSNPYDVLNSYPRKFNKGHHKTEDEYEIFIENILKPSEKHNKERVRLYYVDKHKRKTRKYPNGFKKSEH